MNKEDNRMFYKVIGNSIQENKDRIEKLEKQNANYKKAKKQLQQENKQLKEKIDKILDEKENLQDTIYKQLELNKQHQKLNGELRTELKNIEMLVNDLKHKCQELDISGITVCDIILKELRK